MEELFSRSELIYGKEAMDKLSKCRVAIFGVGGVGGYVVEALARTGIGHFTLIDNDTVALSNFNRQIIATKETLGKYKVDVMKERILSINDKAVVEVKKMFVLPENIDEIDFSQFDYIVDAIDTVKAKLAIISKANELNIPMISSMGAGNKLNPMGFIVTDINKTDTCPLAKKIRYELRQMGIKKLKVVYSKEQPVELKEQLFNENKKPIPGSNAFVPSACGLLIGSEVIKDLLKQYV
jgi:tRNA A37 threonylcarbamoyladenosine dehydratase